MRQGVPHPPHQETPHLTHHSGELSFPGGVCDPGDLDSADTARREAWEEVGIFPENYPLTVNDAEIERLIEVPLAHFARPGVYRMEYWDHKGVKNYPMYFYRHGEDEIWGLTARILKNFLDVLWEVEESSDSCPARIADR